MKPIYLLALATLLLSVKSVAQSIKIDNRSGCALAYQLKATTGSGTDQTPLACCLAAGGYIYVPISGFNWYGGPTGIGAGANAMQLDVTLTDIPTCNPSGTSVGNAMGVKSSIFYIHSNCNSETQCPWGTPVRVRLINNNPGMNDVLIDITN